MKIGKFLAYSVLTGAAVAVMAGCGNTGGSKLPAGEYELKLWVSESATDTTSVVELTRSQIRAFEKANPGVTIHETIEGVTEADSATNMITDVEAGADIFCFAQDQTARLIQAGALQRIGSSNQDWIKKNNDAGTVKATMSGTDCYAYPLTADNGYFLQYNKEDMKGVDMTDLDAIVARCEQLGTKFSFEAETSGWYYASWFFGAGCVSEWTTDSNGNFTDVNDTFASAAGLEAAKASARFMNSVAYNSSSGADDFGAATRSSVLVSGTWATSAAKSHLGDNYAACELPCFKTSTGEKVHLGSFSGCKLMGIKPMEDVKKSAVANKLVQYLTDTKSSLERFAEFGWGPSNLKAQADKSVQADESLAALLKQSAHAVPQGQIHGNWWDYSKALATAVKTAKNDAEVQAALDDYEDKLAVATGHGQTSYAYGIVGSMNGWSLPFYVEGTKGADGKVTYSNVALTAGDEFKIVMAEMKTNAICWDEIASQNYTGGIGFSGVSGAAAANFENGGGNIKCSVTGNYDIVVDHSVGSAVFTLHA